MRSFKAPSLFFILFLSFTQCSVAQQKNTRYDQLWEKVDSQSLKKGLTKTALAEVNNIYALAKKEKQETQLIKALIYRMGLEEIVEENADEKNLRLLENEINASTEPSRSILSSILAYKYYVYYLMQTPSNDRSETKNFKKADVATWSAADFVEKIGSLYLASIKNKQVLQKTMLEPYNPIIIQGNARYLRPTLYDLLAYPALDYFSRMDMRITKPAYVFEMKDDNLFSPASEFIRLKFVTTDTASMLRKALVIYQDLLIFHLNDAKPDALVDADIHRLQLIHTDGVMQQKDQLYEKALTAIADRYPGSPAAAQASYLVANMHVSENIRYRYGGYDNGDTADLTFAAELCKKVLLH